MDPDNIDFDEIFESSGKNNMYRIGLEERLANNTGTSSANVDETDNVTKQNELLLQKIRQMEEKLSNASRQTMQLRKLISSLYAALEERRQLHMTVKRKNRDLHLAIGKLKSEQVGKNGETAESYAGNHELVDEILYSLASAKPLRDTVLRSESWNLSSIMLPDVSGFYPVMDEYNRVKLGYFSKTEKRFYVLEKQQPKSWNI